MRRTRIDRFKVKREMERLNIGAFQDLADLASVSQTTLYAVMDSYSWRAATLDALANALGVLSVTLLTVDEVGEPTSQKSASTPPTSAEHPPPAPSSTFVNAARQRQRDALALPGTTDDERARFDTLKAERLAAANAETARRSRTAGAKE